MVLIYNLAQLKRVLHFQHLSDQYYHIRKHLQLVDSRSRLYLTKHALIVDSLFIVAPMVCGVLCLVLVLLCSTYTVNSEIFARVLFSRKFRENKILVKWRNHCHLLMKVNHVIVANFCVANISFNAICENKFSRKFPNLQYLVFSQPWQSSPF